MTFQTSILKSREEPLGALRFRGEVGFRKVVTAQVEAYLTANVIPARDIPAMYAKTTCMMAWWIGSYLLLLLAGLPWWGNLGLCVSFGLASAGVVFNVMHDANHNGYSNSLGRNRLFGWSIELIGFSSFIWRQQHNVWHHTYTNVSGLDEGLEADLGDRPNHGWASGRA